MCLSKQAKVMRKLIEEHLNNFIVRTKNNLKSNDFKQLTMWNGLFTQKQIPRKNETSNLVSANKLCE